MELEDIMLREMYHRKVSTACLLLFVETREKKKDDGNKGRRRRSGRGLDTIKGLHMHI